MRFCKDCRHYVHFDSLQSECERTKTTDPVEGHMVRLTCSATRLDVAKCGMDAVWFEPKE